MTLINIIKEQGIVNMIVEMKEEMEELEKKNKDDFNFYISITDFDHKCFTKSLLKEYIKKNNHYLQIEKLYKLTKKQMKEELINYQKKTNKT